jgi:hypothetical protein
MPTRRLFLQSTAAALARGAAAVPELPSRRPPPPERKFTSEAVEAKIRRVQNFIADPELAWLFGSGCGTPSPRSGPTCHWPARTAGSRRCWPASSTGKPAACSSIPTRTPSTTVRPEARIAFPSLGKCALSAPRAAPAPRPAAWLRPEPAPASLPCA